MPKMIKKIKQKTGFDNNAKSLDDKQLTKSLDDKQHTKSLVY